MVGIARYLGVTFAVISGVVCKPLPRAPTFKLEPLFSGQQISNGSTVSASQAAALPVYRLTGATPSSGEKFSTFIIGTQDGDDTLIAGYGGQSAVGILGNYILGPPSVTFASFEFPSIQSGVSLELCIYVYEDPATLKATTVTSRDHFNLHGFASSLGLQGPVAEFCITVGGNGGKTSSTTHSTTSTTTSTTTTTKASTTTSTTTTTTSTTTTTTTSSTTTGVSRTLTEPNPAYATPASFNGATYVDKGLVAFGALPGDAKDSTGLSIGGIGSAIALKSINKGNDGIFRGEMWVQPDRGHNTVSTVDYQARRHVLSFTLDPFYDPGPLAYNTSKATFALKYEYTILYDALGRRTTGLDALTYTNNTGKIHYPIPSASDPDVTNDDEGLVVLPDGSSWVSDEYGPYIYKYSPGGDLIQTIVPPASVLPMVNGSLFFAADTTEAPTTGRFQNNGFEGLAISPDLKTLYGLLQNGVTQDADSSGDAAYTRLFAWDISGFGTPKLIHAWVLELPQTNGKGKTLASSEFHCLSEEVFVALSRDAKANGDDTSESKHKDFLLYTTNGATDIVDTNYTTGTVPVAPNQVLVSGVTPMMPTEFVDIIDETQLERFGLHNGDPFAQDLINSKWESMAFASCNDPANPDDYFLFSFSDNDFITLNGVDPTGPYNDPYAVQMGYSLDNQALVWRVTIPNYGQ